MNAEPNETIAGKSTSSQPDNRSHLRLLRFRGSILKWSAAGTILSGISLVLLTGLALSPLLFLLYPVLIALLLVSLSTLTLNLLHRF